MLIVTISTVSSSAESIIKVMEDQGEQKPDLTQQQVDGQPAVPVDPFAAASQSTANYANYEAPEKVRDPIWSKLGAGLAVLVILGGLAGGAYVFLKHHKAAKKAQTSSATTQQTASPPAASQIASTTKHYSSSNFQLAFDYPQDWTLADAGGGSMSVTSPKIKLKNTSSQSISGQIVLLIRNKIQKLPEFDNGNAVATKASVKIAYTKPAQTQRGSTYESFLRYAGNANSTALDAVYITGDNGYTLGQAIPKVDVQKVDPIISLSFIKCSDSTCKGAGGALSVAASSWDDKTFSEPLESMLESLSIN